MPSIYHMKPDDELYRAILTHEVQPRDVKWDPITQKSIVTLTGPVEVREMIIGPYTKTSPIKSFITRQRAYYTNLQLVRVERVTEWTEVNV